MTIVRSLMVLRWFTLALALLIGGALTAPELAEAAPDAPHSSLCKKKRRSKKRRKTRAKKRSPKRAKKITAKTIKRWQKKGWTNAKIVRKAKAKGYVVTKKELRRLRKYRVRKSLRKALKTELVAVAAVTPAKKRGPQRIDLNATIDPDDIDFDSVPPPEGMDMRYADLHRQEAAAGK